MNDRRIIVQDSGVEELIPTLLTRRRFVHLGAGGLGFLPLAPFAGRAAEKPESSRGSDDTAIPTSRDAQRLLEIGVQIDAKGPFRFVVDTGADRTVIAADVAERLGLTGGQQVMVEGIVRTIPAGTVFVRNLSFGPITREALEVPILPRALLGADGYLGLDAVNGYAVTFDFVRQMMRVEEPRERTEPEAEINLSSSVDIPVQGRYGHLRSINAAVDGVRATAFIDSGAEVTIGNRRLLESLLSGSGNHRNEGSVPITGVTGGVAEGRITAIENVRLGNVTFNIPHIVIADLRIFDIWGLDATPAVLIGMNYLSQFSRVTIDYGVKQYRFQLASLATARPAHNYWQR